MDQRFDELIDQLRARRIDRRSFMVRAAALGLSGAAIAAGLNRAGGTSAQDATPGASPAAGTKATDIGAPGIAHITDTSKGTIKLYSSWPLTGTYDQIGGDAVEAVNMALEDYGNAAGGYALVYEALDDGTAANNGGWDPAVETENANRVINDPEAMVYLATYNSGAAKISIPLMNAVPMAMISYANTYPGLTKAIPDATEEGEPDVYYPSGTRNYMRTVPADDIQGSAGANWAFNKQGRRKAYILHDNSLYGQGVARVFQLTFERLGGEILGFDGYDEAAPDYQSLMTSIADTGPDILYCGATVDNNASKLIQDMRGLMPVEDVIFLGPDGLINQAFIDGAGGDATGAYLTFAGFPPSALQGPGADYATRITERLGHPPDSYAVYAYECIAVVVQAIDKAGVNDRAAILEAMLATEGFNSLLGGSWSFTESGDTDALTMSVSIVENDDFKFLENIGSI